MRLAGTSLGRKGLFVFAIGLWLLVPPGPAIAQFFDGPAVLRPPGEVPTPPPATSLAPPSPGTRGDRIAPPSGPTLQSLPPAAPAPAPAQIAPVIPAGQAALALSARFGRDMPVVTGGLVWRVMGTSRTRTVPSGSSKRAKGPSRCLRWRPGAK